MPISRNDALELIEALKRESFGSCDSKVITLEAAFAAVWNHTENDGRPPWQELERFSRESVTYDALEGAGLGQEHSRLTEAERKRMTDG